MKKQVIAFAIVLILIIPLISITVFASVDAPVGGLILDGLWDVGSGIMKAIFSSVTDVIKTIGDGLKVVGGFFANLIKAIGEYIAALLDGIRRLFIPRENYFSEVIKEIHSAFGEKFGWILSLAGYLRERFSGLSANRSTNELFILSFPQGTMLAGTRFDILGVARGVLSFIRTIFTGFITLMTVAFCYRRVLALINT